MKPYYPDGQEPLGDADGEESQSYVESNDNQAAMQSDEGVQAGVIRVQPVSASASTDAQSGQDLDYTYNPAVDMADSIDAQGGSAALQTSQESAFDADTTGSGYSFTPAASVEADDTADDSSGEDTGGDDVEAVRSDIEQTRSQMSTTIDAIQEKLNPQNIVDQAKESVREATIGRVENMVNDVRDTARETGSGFLDTVKQNPLPAALAAVGIGWLYMKSRNNQKQYDYRYETRDNYPAGRYDNERFNTYGGRGYDTGYRGSNQGQMYDRGGNPIGDAAGTVRDKAGDVADSVGDVAGQAKDAAGNAVNQVRNTAGDVVDNVQSKMGEVGSTAQYQAQQAQGQLQRMLYDNPLAVGAAAAVIGAAIGMMIPETQQEHKLLGEARDNVMEKAQTVANQAMDKVSSVAQEATSAAQQAAQDQGLTS